MEEEEYTFHFLLSWKYSYNPITRYKSIVSSDTLPVSIVCEIVILAIFSVINIENIEKERLNNRTQDFRRKLAK